MQSSNIEKAKAALNSYETEYERKAFTSGYDHAHGIACHNVPTIGETYFLESEGHVTADADNIREVHETLCHEAEMNARQFSPWEFVAKEINSLPEFDREAAWEAYDEGVILAISHDLADQTYDV